MIETIQKGKPVFVMIMGLPGSGKSTLRDQLPSNFVRMSTDDIIEDVARWQGKTYMEVFSDEIGPATATVNANFDRAVKDRVSIVWDQTNLTAKKRKKVLSRLPTDYYKILIEVSCDEETRQKRLKGRGPYKVIPPHIDQSMKASRVDPCMDEGWDEIWGRQT